VQADHCQTELELLATCERVGKPGRSFDAPLGDSQRLEHGQNDVGSRPIQAVVVSPQANLIQPLALLRRHGVGVTASALVPPQLIFVRRAEIRMPELSWVASRKSF